MAEGLAVVAACVSFLASRSQWHDYALPGYALSAVAGLVLMPVLLTSRLLPQSLSVLGIVGYALRPGLVRTGSARYRDVKAAYRGTPARRHGHWPTSW